MNTTDQKELLEIVKTHLDKARVAATEARWAAKRMRGASRSQQGDRKFFENAADLAESNLAELEELSKVIDNQKIDTKKLVEPICTVELEFGKGEKTKFFFIPARAGITDSRFLTPQSPLGQAILDKKTGEKFAYEIDQEGQRKSFSGKITKIH